MTAYFIDAEGDIYPITNWLDSDGDECDEQDAETAVAGKDDRWYAFRIEDVGSKVLS